MADFRFVNAVLSRLHFQTFLHIVRLWSGPAAAPTSSSSSSSGLMLSLCRKQSIVTRAGGGRPVETNGSAFDK